VLVDGRYAGTVNLFSPTAEPRAIVFSTNWGTSRRHSIAVRPVARPRGVPVDAFVLLR